MADKWNNNLFDANTGKPVTASLEDVKAGLKAGTYAYGKSSTVNLTDKEGNIFHAPAGEVTHWMNNGYDVESPNQASVREYVDEHKGISGTAKVALGQFADEALGGIPETIYDHTADPLDVAKKEALKKDHQIANTIGGVGGFALGTVIGAPLLETASKAGKVAELAVTGERALEAAKALEVGSALARGGVEVAEAARIAPGIARTAVGKAIGLGVEATTIAAPKALTEAALGDFDAAAEDLMFSAAGGASLGIIGGLAKGVGSKLPSFESIANRQAVKNLNYATNNKVAEAIRALPGGEQAFGKALNENGLVRRFLQGETYEQYAERVNAARKEVGERIGGFYQKLDTVAEGNSGLQSGHDFAKQFKADVIAPRAKELGAKNVVTKLNAVAEDFASLAGKDPMTFGQLHAMRGQLDDMIFREGQIGITDPAKKELLKFRELITKELETKGEALASKRDWQFKKDLDEHNILYRQLKVASRATETSATKEAAGNTFSLTDSMAGNTMALAGLLTGNPLAAIKAAGVATAHKYARQNGNAAMATIANYMSAQSQTKGLLVAEQAMKRSAKRLDELPKILTSLATGIKEKGPSAALAATLRLQQKNELGERINQLVTNPGELERALAVLAEPIGSNGAPITAGIIQTRNLQTLKWLHEQMPKPTVARSPFAGEQPKPNSIEMKKFARKLEVAADPYVVLQHLKAGTLTPEHVAALRVAAPATHKRMVQKIKQFEVSGNAKRLPLSTQRHLAYLTGDVPVPRSNAPQGVFQAAYGGGGVETKFRVSGRSTMPSLQTGIGSITDAPKARRGR